MDQQEATYKDLYGQLTAFIQKLYAEAQGSEASIKRSLHYAETSKSESSSAQVPQLQSMLAQREVICTLLELLLRKSLKQERLAKIPDDLRDLFEAAYSSPEGVNFNVNKENY